MSDETETETTTENAPEAAAEKNKSMLQPTATTVTAPPGVLTRPADLATRPGFRSPANSKSKAQKAKKRK